MKEISTTNTRLERSVDECDDTLVYELLNNSSPNTGHTSIQEVDDT